jgi:hypothetical protein
MNAIPDNKSIGQARPADDFTVDAADEAARQMAVLSDGESRTTAEVLRELRRAFPDMPLAERVAALAALSRS